jgi:hypothetical protein
LSSGKENKTKNFWFEKLAVQKQGLIAPTTLLERFPKTIWYKTKL